MNEPDIQDLAKRGEVHRAVIELLRSMSPEDRAMILKESAPSQQGSSLSQQEVDGDLLGDWDDPHHDRQSRNLINKALRENWNPGPSMKNKALKRVDEDLDSNDARVHQKAVDQVLNMDAADLRRLDVALRNKRLEEGRPTEITKTIGAAEPRRMTHVRVQVDKDELRTEIDEG